MNILVIRLSALGDVAMAIPAIYDTARAYPQDAFYVLTSGLCSHLFAERPQNVHLLAVGRPLRTKKLIRTVRSIPVDMVADLHNVLRSWIIDVFFLMHGKRVSMLRKHRFERQAILRGGLVAQPFTERYYDVFRRLDRPCQPRFKGIFPHAPKLPEDFPKKDNRERWVGIAPFARYDSKVYPEDQMREVVRMLLATENVRVFLFGSKGKEADVLASWLGDASRGMVVAGRYNLSQELSLMAHLDVMLTMDSANMHMASLVSTRVVSLWGGTTPDCGFTGFGQQPADCLCVHLCCQPCSIAGTKNCKKGTLACMYAINPKEIVMKLTNE